MIFQSFSFLYLFPIVFLLYYGASHFFFKSKYHSQICNVILLLVSYLLYIQYNPCYAFILLWVTFITFIGAILLNQSKRFLFITTALILSSLPLIFFKYYTFINNSFQDLFEHFGFSLHLPGLNYAVPLGISFFSLQAIGYLIDVNYQRIPPERNFFNYMLFVAFFPQISSGPISKANDLLPQIKAKRKFDSVSITHGLKLILWGFFLKTVVADRLGIYVDTVYDNYIHYSGKTCLVASLFYSFQIYTDFAGYSLIAVGVAKVMGFNLVNNFKQPYLSISVTDFWHRWHISLSQWLKNSIYIPLGGSRCSKWRNYRNILVTFFISGLWHGANWNFIVWGGLHGTAQIFEKFLNIQKINYTRKIVRVLRIIVTLFFVNFSWIFFRMQSVDEAINFIVRIFTAKGPLFFTGSSMIFQIGLLLVIYTKDIFAEFRPQTSLLEHPNIIVRWSTYILILFAILLFGIFNNNTSNFIYVNF